VGRHRQKVVAREEAYKEARRRSGEERKEGGNMRRCWENLSKKETVWIIIVVGLGLGSAAFAFAAQATRVKVWCRILFLFSFGGGLAAGRGGALFCFSQLFSSAAAFCCETDGKLRTVVIRKC
jgi:hypothetical protein